MRWIEIAFKKVMWNFTKSYDVSKCWKLFLNYVIDLKLCHFSQIHGISLKFELKVSHKLRISFLKKWGSNINRSSFRSCTSSEGEVGLNNFRWYDFIVELFMMLFVMIKSRSLSFGFDSKNKEIQIVEFIFGSTVARQIPASNRSYRISKLWEMKQSLSRMC